ncbi:MAG: phosphoserine transaminase [Hyphomicrobiales bacterium]|nr:phosphoserine transaminase [Hyphomicrobiales bacterium]
MTKLAKPAARPANPRFSSGPCAKRPGHSLDNLKSAFLGRSHRAGEGKARLKRAIDRTREILNIPDAHRVAIVPASDTGALEMALWSLLGERGIDVLAWESFGKGWVGDIVNQLKIEDVRVIEAAYGQLPDLAQVDCDRDVVFTWNGTTSGVRVPDGAWIAAQRKGLTICDATSAVFAQRLDWDKLDATTFSWQKVLGGEAQHGVLVLSPRAVERLEGYMPPWPLPKIFRLTKDKKLMEGVFRGETINTPSMLCVEDWLDTLGWAETIGGLDALIARADANSRVIAAWVAETAWVDFLAEAPETRSNTSVCLRIVDPAIAGLERQAQATFARKIAALLDEEGVAHDIAFYRDAPPGLRIWAGATIEKGDLAALMPWLDWAFETAKSELAGAS